MNPLKVYIQYPWKYADSPYYKYLVQNPPKNVVYLNTEREKGATYNKKKLSILYFLKTQIRKWTNRFNLPIPNVHLSPKGDYDIIHCAHCISRNKDKPWVADLECGFSMFISGHNTKIGRNLVKKLVSRKNCKMLLPWTEQTKKEILELVPSAKNKVKVIYPAVPERKDLKKKDCKKINLIFSGRYFFQKGGLHALESMDRLTKKYSNVYGFFISSVPEEIKKKYIQNKKITFYELVSQEKLFELYNKSHILIYPGYSDSFGFAYLEAMSFGIPTITVDKDYRKEIVEENKTGFIIECKNPYELKREMIGLKEERIIQDLIKKAELLIKDRKLFNTISKNCLKEISEGKFSIKQRDKKLKRIYSDCLK